MCICAFRVYVKVRSQIDESFSVSVEKFLSFRRENGRYRRKGLEG